jgi:hypothetical protein
MTEKVIRMAALRLPAKFRAKLPDELLASLLPRGSKAINAAWAKEIEARIDAFESGRTRSRPIAEVLNRFVRVRRDRAAGRREP